MAIRIPQVPKDQLVTAYQLSTSEGSKKGPIRVDTVGTRNPVYLNSSRFYALSLTSRRYLGPGLGYVPTQYVPGADTIYVNDYEDMNGKLRLGLKSQGYNLDKMREQAVNLNIGFKFGIMNLKEFGDDPALIEFVATHESNSESESGKQAKKNPGVVRVITFKPLRAEKTAAARTQNFESHFEGLEIVKSLRSKKNDGTFEYNTSKMNAIYNILELSHKISESEPAQRFEEILRYCQQDAEAFALLVNDYLKETQILLGKAIAAGLISTTAKSAFFKADGANAEEFLKFPANTQKEEQITEMAYHLIGDPRLKATYNSIRQSVEEAIAVA